MAVNWNLIYKQLGPPVWYRVDTSHGVRYLLMADVGGVLVSLPYFSLALMSKEPQGFVAPEISFTLNSGRLKCSDPEIKWNVRMLRPLSEHCETHKVVSWLPLKLHAEAQMGSLPPDVRRKIRKAGKNGISAICGGLELSKEFYRIYSDNMHRLGAPAMAESFYSGVAEAFGSDAKFVIIRFKGQSVGAALWLKHGNKAEACWFATLGKYNALYSSYLLWWECIRLSCEAGCSVFSFGRSTEGSGTHRYKSQWGARQVRLYWSHSESVMKNGIRFGPVKLKLPGRSLLSGIWKWLPGFIVRRIGPYLAVKFY